MTLVEKMRMKAAQEPRVWIVEIEDAQEMPARTEEFATEQAARERRLEIERNAEAAFASGKLASENAPRPVSWRRK